MTFYTDDTVDIAFVEQTGYWVLVLNGVGVRDARREQTLQNFVEHNSVDRERP